MNKYVIIAESGGDLSKGMIDKYNINMVLMHLSIENIDYQDGSISVEEICKYYDETHKTAKTSSASPYDYEVVYAKIRLENPDAIIIHVCYSSKLSSTYQNSIIAQTKMDNIYRIDSLNASIGQAFVVMKTIKLIENNPLISPEEIVKEGQKYATNTRFSFVPGNLEYLRAGGRVSGAQYLGATIFGLKPLIEMLDGHMVPTKKYRGSISNVAHKMINEFFTRFNIDKEEVYLTDSYKLNTDLRAAIEKQVKEFGVKDVVWLKLGSVITSHSGPSAVGIAGFEKIKI